MGMSIHEWIEQGSVSEKIAERRGLKELVRCKDCKYYSGFTCENMKNEQMIGMIVADDWFCADGKREET